MMNLLWASIFGHGGTGYYKGEGFRNRVVDLNKLKLCKESTTQILANFLLLALIRLQGIRQGSHLEKNFIRNNSKMRLEWWVDLGMGVGDH